MYRKLSIKTLAVAFAALLAWVLVFKAIDSSTGENTLPSTLVSLGDDEVSTIRIFPRSLNGKEVTLVKTGDNWKVKQDDKTYEAEANSVEALISQLNGLKPLRLAAKNDERWAKYEVTDSLATRVVFEKNGSELANLYIGKFSYIQAKNPMPQQNPYMQQPQGTMNTYVRLAEEDEVFAVEGFLGSSFNRDAKAFRKKTITKLSKENITKVTFSYPADSSFVLSKQNSQWMINGLQADSTSVDAYLGKITNLSSSSFTDKTFANATHQITIEGDNMSPVKVDASINADKVMLVSNLNTTAVFEEDLNKTYKKLFTNETSLLK